jgi:hypothetical protein
MSLRILVIPEDPTLNGYILKPLVERIMAEVGKPNARVQLLTNPKLDGYDHARRAIREELPLRYGHFDLWLFLPDADKASGLEPLERELVQRGITLFCCAACPEVEAWLLAGHRDKLSCGWREIITHPRLKEEVFEPFLAGHGHPRRAGGGREVLMREALQNYRGLLELCPELKELEARLRRHLETKA